MDRPIGYWLKEVDRLIEADFARLLAEENLTRRHWQVLNALASGAGSQAEIDHALAPFRSEHEPSTAPAVADLAARGWVSGFALTPEGRAALYPVILSIAARVCIVTRCAPGIDARGLHKTNLAALRDALSQVAVEGCICLSDGFPVSGLEHQRRAVIGGDGRSAAIAAASVLAKETRDRYMRRADRSHPGWEFATHVGYSTPEHRDAIERLGISPLHRRSFQSAAYLQLGLGLGGELEVPPEVLDELVIGELEPRTAA